MIGHVLINTIEAGHAVVVGLIPVVFVNTPTNAIDQIHLPVEDKKREKNHNSNINWSLYYSQTRYHS